MRLANQLGDLVIRLGVRHADLAKSTSEGKVVALATAVALQPSTRDLAALEKASKSANSNFTRYRVVLALAAIVARLDLNRKTLRRINVMLNDMAAPGRSTDEALLRLIAKTRAVVEEKLAEAG